MSTPLSNDPLAQSALPRRWPRNWLLTRWHPFGGRPVDTTALWAGVIAENCLRPYLVEGDYVLLDLSMEPRDRDLVQCEMKFESNGARLGLTRGIVARKTIKQLRIDDQGQRWLVCADGSRKADNHAARGVVILTARPPLLSLRRWKYPMKEAIWPIGA